MELPLTQDITAQDFLAQLNPALPQGLLALDAYSLNDTAPAAMASVFAAQYAYRFEGDAAVLLSKVPAFLQQTTIPYDKKGKAGIRTDDLRPMMYNLLVQDGGLRATLALGSRGTARPDQLVISLAAFAGVEAPPCRITRLALLGDKMQPLEEAIASAHG